MMVSICCHFCLLYLCECLVQMLSTGIQRHAISRSCHPIQRGILVIPSLPLVRYHRDQYGSKLRSFTVAPSVTSSIPLNNSMATATVVAAATTTPINNDRPVTRSDISIGLDVPSLVGRRPSPRRVQFTINGRPVPRLLMLFDGTCGFCSRSVQRILKLQPTLSAGSPPPSPLPLSPTLIHFSSINSQFATRLLSHYKIKIDPNDTFVFFEDG
jgi:hypothetical protein